MTRTALVPAFLVLSISAAAAFSQPPIQGPQDAACRAEAQSKVFSTPDPQGVGLFAIGKQIYTACMQRAGGVSQGKSARRVQRRYSDAQPPAER